MGTALFITVYLVMLAVGLWLIYGDHSDDQ